MKSKRSNVKAIPTVVAKLLGMLNTSLVRHLMIYLYHRPFPRYSHILMENSEFLRTNGTVVSALQTKVTPSEFCHDIWCNKLEERG